MVSNSKAGSQWRRGVLEMCLLRLLRDTPNYGYEIVVTLSRFDGLEAGENTLYPLLRRLKGEGYLETFRQPSPAGPPRQYFKLTSRGSERLAALQSEWQALAASVDRCLTEGDRHDAE